MVLQAFVDKYLHVNHECVGGVKYGFFSTCKIDVTFYHYLGPL